MTPTTQTVTDFDHADSPWFHDSPVQLCDSFMTVLANARTLVPTFPYSSISSRWKCWVSPPSGSALPSKVWIHVKDRKKCHSHSARNDCYHAPLYLRSVLSVAIRSWECGQKAPVLLFAALQWWWIGASKTTIMNLTLIPPLHHGHVVGRLRGSPFQSRARWHKDPVNEPSSWTSHGSSVGQSECTDFSRRNSMNWFIGSNSSSWDQKTADW